MLNCNLSKRSVNDFSSIVDDLIVRILESTSSFFDCSGDSDCLQLVVYCKFIRLIFVRNVCLDRLISIGRKSRVVEIIKNKSCGLEGLELEFLVRFLLIEWNDIRSTNVIDRDVWISWGVLSVHDITDELGALTNYNLINVIDLSDLIDTTRNTSIYADDFITQTDRELSIFDRVS